MIKIKVVIVVFYFVGVLGMLVPASFPVFTKLIPFGLVFSFSGLAFFHVFSKSKSSVLVFLLISLLGLIIEVIGVNTGLVFGSYQYGSSLGIRVFNTPVIIGLNWFLLVYLTASVFEKYKIHNVLKVFFAASLMVAYDLVLEQVAPYLDMWRFTGDIVPFQNYLAWFIIALIFHAVVKCFNFNTENKLAKTIFICQYLFFIILFLFFN